MKISDEIFLCQQWRFFSPIYFSVIIMKKFSCLYFKIPESFSIFSSLIWRHSFELFFFFFTVHDHFIKHLLYFCNTSVLKVHWFSAGAIVIFLSQWPVSLPHLTPTYSSWGKPDYVMSFSQK